MVCENSNNIHITIQYAARYSMHRSAATNNYVVELNNVHAYNLVLQICVDQYYNTSTLRLLHTWAEKTLPTYYTIH